MAIFSDSLPTMRKKKYKEIGKKKQHRNYETIRGIFFKYSFIHVFLPNILA